MRELLTRSSARLQQAQQLQLQQPQREATPTSGNASFAELVSDLNTVSSHANLCIPEEALRVRIPSALGSVALV